MTSEGHENAVALAVTKDGLNDDTTSDKQDRFNEESRDSSSKDISGSDRTRMLEAYAQKVETEDAAPDAIDLVLREIGETDIQHGDANGKLGKTISFDTESSGVEDKHEQNDQTCSNPIYRYKILDTIFLFWNVTTMGWVYGQMGPALPDLQVIGDVQLQEASWLFTGFAIGYLGGCLVAGLIQEKFNPRLMLFLYTVGTGLTMGVLPWLPHFIAMVVIRVINGFCIGGQDTGLHSMLFALWAKEGGPFIQMTHCLSAVGGIISPLVTQPFLLRTEDQALGNSTDGTSNTSSLQVNSTTMNTISVDKEEETRVQYAFMITAALCISAAIPFIVAVVQKRRIKMTSRQYSNDSVDRIKLPGKIKTLILVIIFSNSFIATANIDLFPSFLTTFVIQQIGWTQQSASSLTSLYFGTYGAGNFIGVFILAYISSTALITFSYVASSIALTGILLSVIFEIDTLVWVTVAVSGFSMSAILPTLFTWTQENVTPITGRIASGLLISGSAGVMVNPILLGYMMEEFSPMWFLYLSIGEILLCTLAFVSEFSLAKMCRPKQTEVTEGISNTVDISNEEDINNSYIGSKTEIYSRGTLYGV